MSTILSDGVYKSDIVSGGHGERYQKDGALALFLWMRDNPNLRLGYEVKDAGKFDDIVLIDDENERVHFIQIKHSSGQDGIIKPIDREALFPKYQGKGDFEISKYLHSYVIVRKDFQDSIYRKKFYLLTNRAFEMKTREHVRTNEMIKNFEAIVEQSDGNELLPFFGSKDLTFKLTQNTINKLIDLVNKDMIELKNSIKDLFDNGKINATLKNYTDPLKAVLKIDKYKQCSFLESFILESERSGNNDLYNILKEEKHDMAKEVKVDTNFLQNGSRLKHLPAYVSEEVVKEFIRDFSILESQPHDFRPLIDIELRKWLRTWVQPDILGKFTQSNMDQAYNSLEKSFDELSKPQEDKRKPLLKKEEIQKCLDVLGGALIKLDDEDPTERKEFYINRQITYQAKTERLSHGRSHKIDDTQFVEEFRNKFKNQQCIILVANPGMGKTKLLQFLAFEMQKKYDFNVFLVYFNRLANALNKIKVIEDFNGMMNVLQTVLSKENCDIIRNAPEQRDGKDFSILLVMDGFDEIHSKYTTKVIKMLELMRTKRSIQMLISSRMHTQELLEKELNMHSMFLEPFSEEDQISYLKKWWNVSQFAEQNFKVYSEKLLNRFQRTLAYKVSDVCGLPLMMRVLADVRAEEFEEFLKTVTTNQEQQFDFSNDKLDVVQLYEQFIRKCFYLKAVEKSGGTFDDSDLDTMITGHIWEHQLLALKLLDIEIDETLFKNRDNLRIYDNFRRRCEKESEKSRLVRVIGEDVQFAHLSYGEYFVAKYICDNICLLEADRVLDVLSEHSVIRKFSMLMLDEIDQQDAELHRMCEIDLRFAMWACASGLWNIVNFLVAKFESFSINDLSMMLRITAANGYVEICSLLLERGADPNGPDSINNRTLHLLDRPVRLGRGYGWTALHNAAKTGHVQVIKLLLTAGANPKFCTNDGKTPLHIAIRNTHEKALNLTYYYNAEVFIKTNGQEVALHYATQPFLLNSSDHISLLKLLLHHHADVNAQDKNGRSALHIAAGMGHLEVVKFLIEAGANTNSPMENGRIPLHIAANTEYANVVEFLIKHHDINSVDSKGCTALHLAASIDCATIRHHAEVNVRDNRGWTPLHQAARYGNVAIIKALIAAGAIIKSCTNRRRTPLHIAAEYGKKDAAELIISLTDNVDVMDDEGFTALHLAVFNNNGTLVELLLRHNAVVDAVDRDRCTALHMAAGKADVQAVLALIKAGAKTDCRTIEDKIPLHFAAEYGNEEVAELLIRHSNSVNAVDIRKCTPLHLAVQSCLRPSRVVEVLLRHHANPNDPDWTGQTALHYAARTDREEAAKLLIDHNSDVDAMDDEGSTALHFAVRYRSVALVKLLLQSHANVNAANKAGETPLHMATEMQIIQSLITAGANSSSITNSGRTLLHCAALKCNFEAAQLFISHGNDVNAVDNKHSTALHFAACSYNVALVDLLLQNHANARALDSDGCTPLHMAAMQGSIKVIQSLISAGAITAARTNAGRTPLHEAAQNGHKEAAELLILHNNDVNALDNKKFTALHLAAAQLDCDTIPVAKMLIHHHADVNSLNEYGRSPLQLAVYNDDMIRLLVTAGAGLSA